MREFTERHPDERVYIIVAADEATTRSLCTPYDVAEACIADPDRRTHRAAKLRPAGLISFFSRAMIARARENHRAGFRQNWGKSRIDDLGRVPGAMRIDARGTVSWIFRGKHAGDLPPVAELVAR